MPTFENFVQAKIAERLFRAVGCPRQGQGVGLAAHDKDWLAAATQFPGTLVFNHSTFAALAHNLSAAQADKHVWWTDHFDDCACFDEHFDILQGHVSHEGVSAVVMEDATSKGTGLPIGQMQNPVASQDLDQPTPFAGGRVRPSH